MTPKNDVGLPKKKPGPGEIPLSPSVQAQPNFVMMGWCSFMRILTLY